MIYDLTMPVDENTPMFPECPKPKIEQVATIKKQGWNEKLISISSHCGTHIDAPIHLVENGKSLSDYPLDKFIGEGIVINAKDQNPIKPDLYQVKKDDIVFFYTGWSNNAYTDKYYTNNPTITMKTAQNLIEKKIKIFGIDSWTSDKYPYKIHKLFFKNDILIVENLVNLEELVGKRFKFTIAPLNIDKGDAAPCRVIAEDL